MTHSLDRSLARARARDAACADATSTSSVTSVMVRRILRALGLAVASAAVLATNACGGNVFVDRPDQGGNGSGGSAGGGGTAGTGGTGGTTTIITTSTTTTTDTCVAYGELFYACMDTTFEPCPALDLVSESLFAEQIQQTIECTNSGCCILLSGGCGPDPEAEANGACCYWVDVAVNGCGGRPFIASGEARTAAVAHRSDWGCDMALPETASLDDRVRAVLAGRFREAALFEHASVASFARFTLELLRLGAPADLVAGAQRAMGDEVRHAQLCFSLASAYAGAPMGPSALATEDALGPRTASEIALAVALEGCFYETISAVLAAAEADRATDPAVRAALAAIAEDEGAHAELAWRSLSWLLANSDVSVTRAVAQVFLDAPDFEPRAAPEGGADAAVLAAHGWLSTDEKRAIAASARRDVVIPCAQALLARHMGERATGVLAPAQRPLIAMR